VGINNTWQHEFRKFQIFWALRKQGHNVMTETIFTNGKRADIIDMDNGVIFEVTFTETEKKLEEKTEHYPEIFEIRRIDATKEFDEKMLL